MTSLRVAVDFGASNTCAMLALGAAPPQVVLVDGAPLMPSAVYADPRRGLFVGQEAQRQAGVDPARYEPHPKRRIDEAELLLGDTVVPLTEVIRAVLARVVAEARRAAGGAPVDRLVLTHPADWGNVRPAVLRRAAQPLAREILLIPEPVAAALCYAADVPAAADIPSGAEQVWRPGDVLAVLDLGGGTVDASVVQRTEGPPERGVDAGGSTAVRVLATRGDPAFGGADIDQTLFEHVGALASTHDPASWRALADGRELADRRSARALRADIRTAKETLSRHAYADVPMPPPLPDVHLTRTDLERLTAPALSGAVALLEATLAEAGGAAPTAVFLIGGSSRIPLVARLVHQRLGIVARTLEMPETAVALGALRCAPERAPERGPGRGAERGVTRQEPVAPELNVQDVPSRRWPRLAAAGVLAGAVATAVAFAVAGVGEWRATTTVTASGYSVALPSGWEQTPGDSRLHEVRLFPAGARGPAVVLVQQNRLGYDSTATPARPGRELRSKLARSAPGRYSGFDPEAVFAGRAVAYYREHPADGSTVDWYVLFHGHLQLSVGCRYSAGTQHQVEQACHEVVRTARIRE